MSEWANPFNRRRAGVGELARFHIEKDTKVYARPDDVVEKRLGARTWHW